MRKVEISNNELKRLYEIEKLSSRQIARKFKCGKTKILEFMKIYGIKARSKKETAKMVVHHIKYNISKEELIELYIKQNLSMGQIADIFKTHSSTICSKIKKYKIPARTFEEGNILSIPRRSNNIAKSNNKYKKCDFSNDILEKSYLIGFRLGDLHVRKSKYGETVFVSCKTTKMEQLKLIEDLFSKYGKVKTIGPYKNSYMITCNLNLSFCFLLDKKDEIEDWIINDKDIFVAFLAGYIDAEGHFGIDRIFGEFAISSYDKNIISGIYEKLSEFGINTQSPWISKKEGYTDKRGVCHKKDLWTLKIRRKNKLLELINLIENNVKHQKRYRDMLNVKNNVINRGIKTNA